MYRVKQSRAEQSEAKSSRASGGTCAPEVAKESARESNRDIALVQYLIYSILTLEKLSQVGMAPLAAVCNTLAALISLLTLACWCLCIFPSLYEFKCLHLDPTRTSVDSRSLAAVAESETTILPVS